jgi:hypothetical protein
VFVANFGIRRVRPVFAIERGARRESRREVGRYSGGPPMLGGVEGESGSR